MKRVKNKGGYFFTRSLSEPLIFSHLTPDLLTPSLPLVSPHTRNPNTRNQFPAQSHARERRQRLTMVAAGDGRRWR